VSQDTGPGRDTALRQLKDAERLLLRALKAVQGVRFEQEHIELLSENVRACRDVAGAIGHLLAGNTAPADALLTVEEAQRQIERARLQEAIRDTARRHGWRAT
jgi:hypothetical protein